MTMLARTLTAAVAGAMLTAGAAAQSAREIVGPSPYNAVENESEPRLVVDPPLADRLAVGVVQIQYRVENVRILTVFGAAALSVSPRLGHLHITVDDLPWHWADTSDSNTIDVVGLPPGQHKVLIELVNPEHEVFPACATCRQAVTFTIPDAGSGRH
jgi:hypothetical protein